MVESVFAPIVFVAAVVVVIGFVLYRRSRHRSAHEQRRRTGT
jgi:hypothetical protein